MGMVDDYDVGREWKVEKIERRTFHFPNPIIVRPRRSQVRTAAAQRISPSFHRPKSPVGRPYGRKREK